MTPEQFNLYFSTRLAFVDRPNVRIRTEDDGDCVKVECDERLAQLVFPDVTKRRAPYYMRGQEPPSSVEVFPTIGPNPPIRFHGEVTVHRSACSRDMTDDMAREIRRKYDEGWREELT